MQLFATISLFVAITFCLQGCAGKGPYDPSDEHCSLWYLMGLEPGPERLNLQHRCMVGYYKPMPAPQN